MLAKEWIEDVIEVAEERANEVASLVNIIKELVSDWRELKAENEKLKSTDKELRDSILMHHQLNNKLKKENEIKMYTDYSEFTVEVYCLYIQKNKNSPVLIIDERTYLSLED